MITKRKSRIRHCLKHMVPGHHRQTYDLTFVVKTETIVFFLGNKMKFCAAVLFLVLDQGFPNWGTCTPRGTFAYLKGYI